MSYVKNYNVGQTKLDLPYANYIHELPLLSFGDVQHTINLSLVFNQQRKAAGDNSFNIASGFKLNMQKRIVKSNGTPTHFEEADGRHAELTYTCGVYTFDDKTQRILRSTSTGYEIEYPDFSKETFNSNGYITGVYSKYDKTTPFLTYGYTNGRLTSIVYRGTKTITLGYNSSNKLSSITYANKTIKVTHGTDLVTFTHFSGVDYHLDSSGNNLVVHSADNGASYSSIYSHRTTCTKTASAITFKKEIGSKTVDTTTYDFLQINGDKITVLDVTNKDGVKTRSQLKDDELLYSYEVGLDNDGFVNGKYYGNVNVNRVLNNASKIYSKGVRKPGDGLAMTMTDRMTEISWDTDLPTDEQYDGIYIISGWIKLLQEIESETIKMIVAENANNISTVFFLPTPPVDQWTYFSVGLPYTMDHMCAYIKKVEANVETRDFQVSFQESTPSEITCTSNLTQEIDLLVLENDDEGDKYFWPNIDCQFYNGATIISDPVTINDLLQHKINQKHGKYQNTIFYDDCKKAVTSAGALCIKYSDGGVYHTVNVTDLAIGKKHNRNGNTYITKTNYYEDASGNDVLITKSLVDGVCYKEDVYNDKLDIVSSTIEGSTVYYDYDSNGLIVRQITAPKSLSKEEALANATRADVMVKQYSYNEAEGKTTLVDEFGNSTVYEIDSTWGVVSKITLPDGTVITDNYDDDKCALVSREFSNATNARNTAFTYSGGNLTGLTHGDGPDSISFTFAHEGGKLVNVHKGTSSVEDHEHTDTTLDSYYPSKASTVYSVLSDFDKYGRLTKTDGIVENVYDVMPEYDTNGDLIAKSANGSALLATSKDLTNSKTTKHLYNVNKQLYRQEIANSSNTVIAKEEYTYDAIGRLTTDKFTYDNLGGKYVEGVISYKKTVTDPLADGRISTYSYRVQGVEKAKTINGYDAFKRNNSKSYVIGGKTFTKTIEYDKTRVKKVTDSAGGVTEYQYDAMGRITKAGDMEYTYDKYGQLTEEKDVSLDKTIQYVYNGIGNIKSVSTTYSSGTPSTQTFTYGDTANPDRLTAFGSKAITYNAMGCPTSYDGKNFMWYDGKLSSVSKGSGLGRAVIAPRENYFYTYNAKGQRTHKDYSYLPVDLSATYYYTRSINTEYAYDNAGRLIREHRTYTYSNNSSYSLEFIFLYDESGMVGVQFMDGDAAAKVYYYQKNLQGDVVAIYDTAGAVQAKYSYDAFGNCSITNSTNTHLANYNPIRYRGYYFDDETGWYYLNARYYSPEWRRFISPDDTAYLDPENVNGLNLYCYCGNDPVNIQYNSSLMNVSNTVGGMISQISSNRSILTPNSYEWMGTVLAGLSCIHGAVDKVSSYLVGSLDGLLNYAGISKLNGFQSKLSGYSNLLLGIGIGLDVATSAYNNFNNPNLTTTQKWARFGADIGYIGVTSALSYGAGILVTKGAVALGTSAIGYSLGATIGGVTIGAVGAISIGAGVVIIGVVAGTIIIAVVSDALDNWWDQKKEEWFS